MRKALFALIAATLLFASSCAQAGGSGDQKATITSVSWLIQNRDYLSGATCGYSFSIYYEGDIGAEDVESARIYLPDGSGDYWDMDLAANPDMFDAANSRIGGSGFIWGGSHDALPIGTLKAVLTLKNGSSSERSFVAGVPGSTGTNGYEYVYTESYDTGSGDIALSVSKEALARATVSSGTYDATSVYLNFTIADTRAFNGFVWAYDADGNYLGVSHRFYDPETHSADPYLNGGSGLKVDGTANSAVLKADDFYGDSGTALSSTVFAQIRQCEVVLLDGAQYAEPGDNSAYDYRSIANAVTLSAK